MQKLRPDMDIGQNIRRLRKISKMTQDQVIAQMQLMGIEISKSSYAKIETNRMNIKISELMALKIIFNVEISEFFDNLLQIYGGIARANDKAFVFDKGIDRFP